MSPSIEIFKSVLGNDFGKSAKDHGLKVNTNVVLYEELDCGPKIMGSATISDVDVTDPDVLQRLLYGVDLNGGSGYVLIVINTVVIDKDNVPILYPYGFHCTLLYEVRETLGDVSKRGLYYRYSMYMKVEGNKRNCSSSKRTSEQKRKEVKT